MRGPAGFQPIGHGASGFLSEHFPQLLESSSGEGMEYCRLNGMPALFWVDRFPWRLRSMRLLTVTAFCSFGLGLAAGPMGHQKLIVTVHGYVDDSIAERPLSGANVQFTGMDPDNADKRFTVQSDSFGRFTISDVPTGRYLVGFFNPALDTMGIEPHGRAVTVERKDQTIALGTPSIHSIIAAVCGEDAPPGFGLLLGHTRDADIDTGLAGVSVVVSWMGAHEENAAVTKVRRFVSVESKADGLFAACGLPANDTLNIRAIRGAGSSAYDLLTIPKNGLRHITVRLPKPSP